MDPAGEGLDFGQRYDPSQLGVVTSRDEDVSGKRIRLQLLAAVGVSVIDEGQPLSVGALRSRQSPLPDCVGQVGHPLRQLRADRLQGHAARVHAVEQADSGAEQHG